MPKTIRRYLELNTGLGFETPSNVKNVAVRNTVATMLAQMKKDSQNYEFVRSTCKKEWNELDTKSGSIDISIAKLHTCFMPLLCSAETKAAMNCVNKNHQELHGCETEIDRMMKCSIDKFHRYLWQIINHKSNSNTEENDVDDE